MTPAEQLVIQHTENWIEQVVIGLNLCPFAASVFEANRIAYLVMEGSDTAAHLQQLADCLADLDNTAAFETSLLIYPQAYRQFDDYLDFLEISNGLLEELNYTGRYQIASFHPDYLFEGSSEDDASNYSNRSPYPMLHLLRERSIETAISSYPDVERVPDNNIKKLRQIGLEEMQSIIRHILNQR
jgi:hypothetical protein